MIAADRDAHSASKAQPLVSPRIETLYPITGMPIIASSIFSSTVSGFG